MNGEEEGNLKENDVTEEEPTEETTEGPTEVTTEGFSEETS